MSLQIDEETGEFIPYALNEETGERERNPHLYTTYKQCDRFKMANNQKSTITEIETSSTNIAALLFLIPTAFFCFHTTLLVMYFILETVLHVWSHRQNRRNDNENHVYQSPLHIVAKEFCTLCREEEAVKKIAKFQDQRADRFKKYGLEYVRRIVN